MTASISRQLSCLALLSLLSLSIHAQTKGQQQETIKIKTDLVVLDALVTDKKSREIIRILEDHRIGHQIVIFDQLLMLF